MADESPKPRPEAKAVAVANTAVPHGDHDRVAMLSLHSDGTPNQTDVVETVLDPDTFREATRAQFAQQAVSAADTDHVLSSVARGVTLVGDEPEEERSTGDPVLDKVCDRHTSLVKEAHTAADQATDAVSR